MKKLIFLATALILGVVFNAGTCTPMDAEEGVEIGGVIWATCNVGAPGKFVATPSDAGMFYQWNRKKGWPATGDVKGWPTTLAEGTIWAATNDPCPRGWHVPTVIQLDLLAAASKSYASYSGVNGVYFGTAPNQIFLPAAGMRSGSLGSDVESVGVTGYYWSIDPSVSDNATAYMLFFWTGSMGVPPWPKSVGLSVRCVKKN